MLYLEAKKKFLKVIESYCSKDTYIYYTNCFRVYSYFLFPRFNYETYDINDINEDLIIEYISYLRNLNIKNVSIRTYIRGLKSFYNYCNLKGYCSFKIDKSIKLPRNDSEHKLPLTVSEVNSIIAYISDIKDKVIRQRNMCIVYLMLDCGLRLQEVVNLQVQDVHTYCIVIRNSKYNKNRIVPLSSFGYEFLNRYMDISRLPFMDTDCVFIKSNLQPITKNTIKQLFRRLKKVVPRVHPHLLRHTFATSYIMGGGNLEILRVLLGHSSYNVTQNYVSLAAELSLARYSIYQLESLYFDVFNYNKKAAPDEEPLSFAETSGIRTPDNLIKRKGV